MNPTITHALVTLISGTTCNYRLESQTAIATTILYTNWITTPWKLYTKNRHEQDNDEDDDDVFLISLRKNKLLFVYITWSNPILQFIMRMVVFVDFVGGPFRSLNVPYKDKQRHGFRISREKIRSVHSEAVCRPRFAATVAPCWICLRVEWGLIFAGLVFSGKSDVFHCSKEQKKKINWFTH